VIKKQQEIKAIIFDVGGVILDLNKKKTLRIPESISTIYGISIEEARKIWVTYDRRSLLTGAETPKTFLRNISRAIDTSKTPETLYEEWTKLSLKEENCIDWKLLDFIKNLREKYKIYVMSNAVNIAQEDKLTRTIKSMFDKYFVSYEEGFRKPEKEAFLNVLKKIDCNPENCIFVDDTLININTAKEMKINSIIYKSLEQLKKDIKEIVDK